jgi:hypothetical protein
MIAHQHQRVPEQLKAVSERSLRERTEPSVIFRETLSEHKTVSRFRELNGRCL